MDLITANPILSVLLTLLASSTGTLFLSRLFMSKKDEADVARDLYTALSQQVTYFSGRVEDLQRIVDDWREKHFKLMEECSTLRMENQHLIGQISELTIECNELKQENNKLRAEFDLINPKPALFQSRTTN